MCADLLRHQDVAEGDPEGVDPGNPVATSRGDINRTFSPETIREPLGEDGRETISGGDGRGGRLRFA